MNFVLFLRAYLSPKRNKTQVGIRKHESLKRGMRLHDAEEKGIITRPSVIKTKPGRIILAALIIN